MRAVKKAERQKEIKTQKNTKTTKNNQNKHNDNDNDNDNDIKENIIKEKQPTKKEIDEFCKTIAKRIDVNLFYEYYASNNWEDKDGIPINWKQKVISWTKREVPPKETPPKSPYKDYAVWKREKELEDAK